MDLISGPLKGASLVLMMMFVSPLCPVTSRLVVACKGCINDRLGMDYIQYLCNFNPALSPQIAWRPLLVVVGPIIPQRLPRASSTRKQNILHKYDGVLCSLLCDFLVISLSPLRCKHELPISTPGNYQPRI